MTKSLHNDILTAKCLYKPLDEESLSKIVLVTPERSNEVVETNYFGTKIIILLILFVCFFIFLPPLFRDNDGSAVSMLSFNSVTQTVHIVDSKFISIGLDSSVIAEGFKKFDMRSNKLKAMMQHLSPGYMRVGGTLADRLLFTSDDYVKNKINSVLVQDGDVCAYENQTCSVNLRPNFTMSGTEWLQLNKLAAETGFVILFDLNSLTRYSDGSWNSTNAKELISFSNQHNLTVIWQLGNEPNAYPHVFNYTVSATQMAQDFAVLRKILNGYPRYKNAFLVGPDVTRPRPENDESEIYLDEFLADGRRYIDALTWHQYYFNGRTATVDDFLDPDIFDVLDSQIDTIYDIIHNRKLWGLPVWLGETAAAYGGGAPGYNNRYIGTFIWLDKLGIAAKKGLSVVVRQSIVKGYYALLDDEYNPTPDYWISVLHKKLVGPEVVSCSTAKSPKVRLYCQCTNKRFAKSSITVYGMNIQGTNAVLRIQDFTTRTDKVSVFILTSKFSLLSKYIYLNKEPLIMIGNNNLPPLKPHVFHNGTPIVMPPYSLFFVVMSDDTQICMY